jgi:hypothetical protein
MLGIVRGDLQISCHSIQIHGNDAAVEELNLQGVFGGKGGIQMHMAWLETTWMNHFCVWYA